MHLGLIGYGTIARLLMGVLAREGARLDRVTVLSLPAAAAEKQAALAANFAGPSAVVTEAAALIDVRPKLVIECAGHAAVQAHVPAVLRAGVETVLVSIGALADEVLHAQLASAACAGGTRLILPAGAIGGIDILSALRASDITAVVYTGRKPPAAWRDTPADTLFNADALDNEVIFFTGSAREAATLYPKNANVAATLALAGIGWDATQVRLIADPAISRNVHEYTVSAGAADYTIRIEGNASPDNPKTSATTVYSVAREVLNRQREVAI